MPEVDALMPEDPATLGPYRLTGRLGEGGQGTVFRGEGPSGERVAIKLLHARLAADADARRRFVQEAAVAGRVARFCTAKVLHADVAGNRPYIVSEFVEGVSLADLVARQGPRTEGALERLAIGTATALVAIHQAGLVHRDLKPQNVLMGSDGPRVIDFGIAKALDSMSSQTSQIIGTPAYMAPEQIRGEALTPAVDTFAWACMIAFAGTGAAPFGQDAMPAVINRILNEEPRLAGLPPQMEALLRACLSKDPARRPTARRLLARLLGEEDEHDGSDLLTRGTDLAAAPTTPPGGYLPTQPATSHPPASGYAPASGHAPADGPAPAVGNTPAGGHAPVGGYAAAGGYVPTQGAGQYVPPGQRDPAPAAGQYGGATRPAAGHEPSGRTQEVRRPVRPVVWILPAVLVAVIAALGGALAMSLMSGDGGGGGSSSGRASSGGAALSGSTAPPSSTPSSTSSSTPSGTPPSSGFPAEYAGTWTGTVRQSDGHTWPIRLTMAAGSSVGQVTYDDPGCSGIETLLSKSDGTLSLREDITQGKNACTDQGSVTLRLQQDGTIAFTYLAQRDTGSGGYSATAVLRRS
ncbi:serine/threonine-protein kinase [Actinomadura fibrosa]|uniref:Protein kinase n=1 Tax=Actinomadura fibrosa TaxID=111802 RepID=A0ABW2XDE6_9ACTN|nr:serine/threonine-protein kinase [Actinomadura fibrosa]